jgi:hypothetical protein
MFGTIGTLGAAVPGSGIGNGKALAMEVLLTAGLVNTILARPQEHATSAPTVPSRWVDILPWRDFGRRLDEPGEIVRAGFSAR